MAVRVSRDGSSHGLYQAYLLLRPARVMVADGREASRAVLTSALRTEGYEVIEASDRGELFAQLGDPLGSCSPCELPELVIADLPTLGGAAGLEVLAPLRRAGRSTPVILLAGGSAADEAADLRTLGAAYVFDRGCSVDAVRSAALSLLAPA